jgi:hypothetical protein
MKINHLATLLLCSYCCKSPRYPFNTAYVEYLGSWVQGCQMLHIQTKNSILGKFFPGLAIEDFGLFYVHSAYFTYGRLIYFMAIWHSLRWFGIFFPVLVYSTKKYLATLAECKVFTSWNTKIQTPSGSLKSLR